jgi:hypothetical protein
MQALNAEVQSMQASFEEKNIWIQLITMGVALGAYFVVAWQMIQAGVDRLIGFVPLFGATVVFLVVLQLFGHAAAAIWRRPEPRDERDRLISWRSESNSSWILASGVVLAIGAMIVEVGAVWVAHGLLLSLFASHMVGYVMQLVYYRRGMRGPGGL